VGKANKPNKAKFFLPAPSKSSVSHLPQNCPFYLCATIALTYQIREEFGRESKWVPPKYVYLYIDYVTNAVFTLLTCLSARLFSELFFFSNGLGITNPMDIMLFVILNGT
jgi:hypothetical protein